MNAPPDIEQQKKIYSAACQQRFKFWFENGARIQPKDPTAGLIMPNMNGMQDRINEAIEYCEDIGVPCRIVNLKPRQGGSTTVFLGKAYHKARSSVCNVAIIGDDGKTTDKMLKQWDRFADNDPMTDLWGNKAKTTKNEVFTHGSSLIVETANDPRAGQGATIQVLIASEVASYRSSGHSTGEDVFSAIAGCVPKTAGTIIILESTAQGMLGIFYTTYNGAVTFEEFKAGKRGNGYIKFFTPWFAFDDYQYDGKNGRPSLTQEQRQHILDTLDEREQLLLKKWGAKITPEKLAWRRDTIAGPDCGGNPDSFDREYPEDDISCFRSTGTQMFDADGILFQESMAAELEPQIMTGDIILQEAGSFARWIRRHDAGGEFRIFELPIEDEYYSIVIDWCVGKQAAGSSGKLDAHSIKVWRAARLNPLTNLLRKCQAVATTYAENRSDTDVAIDQVVKLHLLYGGCICVPEINNKDNIVQRLEKAGVKKIWTQRTGADGAKPGQGKTEEVKGFLTTGTISGGVRKQILDHMVEVIREKDAVFTFWEVVNQCKVFIRNSRGRGEAQPGEHDDEVTQTAIALYTIGDATQYKDPRLQAAKTVLGNFKPQPLQPGGGL